MGIFKFLKKRSYVKTQKKQSQSIFDHFDRGYRYCEKGQYDLAIKEYEAAHRIEPENLNVIVGLGNVYRKKGDFGLAVTQYRRALKIDPNLAQSYLNIGEVCEEQGKVQEAIECFQKFADLVRPKYMPSVVRDAEERIRRLKEEL
jgi:tetratricopeptide (TPR) repeat protein